MALVVKNPPANAGDIRNMGLISGLGRCPGRVLGAEPLGQLGPLDLTAAFDLVNHSP